MPVYNKEEINKIEKTKLIHRFKPVLDIVETNPYMDTYKLMVEILEKGQREDIVHKTIQSLAHYLEVPDKIITGEEQS